MLSLHRSISKPGASASGVDSVWGVSMQSVFVSALNIIAGPCRVTQPALHYATFGPASSDHNAWSRGFEVTIRLRA
ncbi:hypothetical protein BQ8482_220164 [Mesorhizobium delmotii]|uniref:Uncharacterized protein n=1 Tax=Mesorhizobium delmotii TaxID=1631247 RepID=A0A2P9ALL1_9HYPH|nr:hypothetical protein BQ8482_220164 [Mesorhizobium delmotii]